MALFRYLVIEDYTKDDDPNGFVRSDVIGSYETYGEARKAIGAYITDNAKRMNKKYRYWHVRKPIKEQIYFPIKKGKYSY